MSDKLEEELNRGHFGLVKYGLWIIILTIVLILVGLSILKIGQQSILEMVIDYYF
jgi:uncharacterized membrane protein YpjA